MCVFIETDTRVTDERMGKTESKGARDGGTHDEEDRRRVNHGQRSPEKRREVGALRL